jgi:hypothetical protein
MATRLYPITEDPSKMEEMAGVPTGTSAALKAIEARFASKSGETSAEAFAREEQKFNANCGRPERRPVKPLSCLWVGTNEKIY